MDCSASWSAAPHLPFLHDLPRFLPDGCHLALGRLRSSPSDIGRLIQDQIVVEKSQLYWYSCVVTWILPAKPFRQQDVHTERYEIVIFLWRTKQILLSVYACGPQNHEKQGEEGEASEATNLMNKYMPCDIVANQTQKPLHDTSPSKPTVRTVSKLTS